MFKPKSIFRQVRHLLTGVLADGGDYDSGAKLAQFLTAVKYLGPVVPRVLCCRFAGSGSSALNGAGDSTATAWHAVQNHELLILRGLRLSL